MPRRKTRYFPAYGADLPNSGPDWIWARAISLVDAGRYATVQRDGPLVVRAARLLRAIRRGFTGRKDRLILQTDKDLVAAERFRGSSPSAVLEMHMRVLAGQGPKTIAAHVSMPETVVHTYGSFFFDVAHRLGQRNFLIHRVIGLRPNIASTPEQTAMIAAYEHGAEAIDPWLDWYANRFDANDLTTSVGRMREAIDLRYQSGTLMDQETTSDSVSKILPILAKLRPKMFFARSANNLFRENLATMSRELRFTKTQRPTSEGNTNGVPRKSEPERDDTETFDGSCSETQSERTYERPQRRQLPIFASESIHS